MYAVALKTAAMPTAEAAYTAVLGVSGTAVGSASCFILPVLSGAISVLVVIVVFCDCIPCPPSLLSSGMESSASAAASRLIVLSSANFGVG